MTQTGVLSYLAWRCELALSCCSTDSERLHRYYHLPKNSGSRRIAYPSHWAGRCHKNCPFPRWDPGPTWRVLVRISICPSVLARLTLVIIGLTDRRTDTPFYNGALIDMLREGRSSPSGVSLNSVFIYLSIFYLLSYVGYI